MTTLTQGIEHGEFMLSEANGMRSREEVTVTVAGAVALPSGTVLGQIAATGKYIKHDNALANDAGGAATAVLLYACDGVNGDYKRTVIARDAEVIGNRLNGGAALHSTVKTDLAAVGIIVR